MDNRKPVTGGFYRHFKGNIYQVKSLAKHSETNEMMVVYQAMYPPFGMWVRPVSMFMGEVDKAKYPEVEQKYRFQEIRYKCEENEEKSDLLDSTSDTIANVTDENIVEHTAKSDRETDAGCEVDDKTLKEALIEGLAESRLEGKLTHKEIAERGFMELLDAETYHEKYQMFVGLKQYLNERLLSNIAVALDIVLEDGSEEEHFDEILKCLQTMEHYEGRRLR